MAFRRTRIPDFDGFNLIYANATVTAWNVVAGVKGTTKITLYDALTGTGTVANPQILTSRGHWLQDLYVEDATILEVTGLAAAGNHDTAVIYPRVSDADVADAAIMADIALAAVQQSEDARKKAAASAAAAAASAAAISDENIALAASSYAI